jgi:hypothetical protein
LAAQILELGNKKPSEASPGGFKHPLPERMRFNLPHIGETLLNTLINKSERARVFGPQILQLGASRLIMAHLCSRFHLTHPLVRTHYAWRGDINSFRNLSIGFSIFLKCSLRMNFDRTVFVGETFLNRFHPLQPLRFVCVHFIFKSSLAFFQKDLRILLPLRYRVEGVGKTKRKLKNKFNLGIKKETRFWIDFENAFIGTSEKRSTTLKSHP